MAKQKLGKFEESLEKGRVSLAASKGRINRLCRKKLLGQILSDKNKTKQTNQNKQKKPTKLKRTWN